MLGSMNAVHLTERASLVEAKVTGNVIKDVVLLGLDSRNDRRYSPNAVKEAVEQGFYNCKIYADHVTEEDEAKNSGVRPMREWIGVALNSRFDGEKVRADVKILTTDPQGAKLLEAAKDPDLARHIGMSHDATGEIEEIEGIPTVTRIIDVESTDAVTKPATTQSLFESEKQMNRIQEMGVGDRVRVQSSESDEVTEMEVAGEPMVKVKDAEGNVHTVPMSSVSEMEDEEEPQEAEEPEETPEMEPEKKTPESTRRLERENERLLRENKHLKTEAAKVATDRAVAQATADLTPKVREMVTAHFAGKVASAEIIEEYIGHVEQIVEAVREDTGVTDDMPIRRFVEADSTDNNIEMSSLVAGAFPGFRSGKED